MSVGKILNRNCNRITCACDGSCYETTIEQNRRQKDYLDVIEARLDARYGHKKGGREVLWGKSGFKGQEKKSGNTKADSDSYGKMFDPFNQQANRIIV